MRAPEGDAYLVKPDNRRYHIPTGGDYTAMTGSGIRVRNLTGAQVDSIPNSGLKAIVRKVDDPQIHDPWGTSPAGVDQHGHAGDRYYTWTTTRGAQRWNHFTWNLSQAPGRHRLRAFVPHREVNANNLYRIYDKESSSPVLASRMQTSTAGRPCTRARSPRARSWWCSTTPAPRP